jgi:hypothetical protein
MGKSTVYYYACRALYDGVSKLFGARWVLERKPTKRKGLALYFSYIFLPGSARSHEKGHILKHAALALTQAKFRWADSVGRVELPLPRNPASTRARVAVLRNPIVSCTVSRQLFWETVGSAQRFSDPKNPLCGQEVAAVLGSGALALVLLQTICSSCVRI